MSASSTKIEYPTTKLLHDLWELMKGKRILFIIGTILRFSACVIWLYPVYAFSRVVSNLSHLNGQDTIWWIWFFLISSGAATLVGCLLNYISNYIVFRILIRMFLDSEISAIHHLLLLDIAWHEHENTGNKIKRIDRGSNAIENMMRMWHNTAVSVLVSLIGGLSIIVAFDGIVMGMIVLFIIIYVSISFQLVKKTRAAVKAVNIAEEEFSGLTFEAVNNVRTVKVLGMVETITKRIRVAVDTLYAKCCTRVFWFQVRGGILETIIVSFRITILAYIVVSIFQGKHDVGFLVLFFGYFAQISDNINRLAELSQDYMIARQSLGRMKEITDVSITIDDDSGKRAFPKSWETLTLSNVSFHYHDKDVLKKINLEIKRGEKIGIVGLSGAGKSTLFKLLLKEYEDYTGDIVVNDVPLKGIKRSAYLDHIAVVMQETEVFNFSLIDEWGVWICNHPAFFISRQ
ncbi:MAG: ABC transporter ATP-binding protein [Patescibacteria group bacterium]